jgi:hypothetical protein
MMPIVNTDLRLRYSVLTAGGGNVNPQPNVNLSLGRFLSITDYVNATKNNLYDDVTGDENAAGAIDYRCLFAVNMHATITWINVKVWLPTEVAGGASMAIGIDPTAASAVNAAADQALTVANENTAPAGVAFSNPGTKAAGLNLGDIGPGQCRAIWFRRTATNSGALNDDGVDFSVEGDTTD